MTSPRRQQAGCWRWGWHRLWKSGAHPCCCCLLSKGPQPRGAHAPSLCLPPPTLSVSPFVSAPLFLCASLCGTHMCLCHFCCPCMSILTAGSSGKGPCGLAGTCRARWGQLPVVPCALQDACLQLCLCALFLAWRLNRKSPMSALGCFVSLLSGVGSCAQPPSQHLGLAWVRLCWGRFPA